MIPAEAINQISQMRAVVQSEMFATSVLQELLDCAPVPVIIGAAGQWLLASGALARMLGYTREQLEAIPWIEAIHETDRPAVLQACRLAEDGKSTTVIARSRHRDGSWRRIDWAVGCPGARGHVIAVGRALDT